MQIIGPLTKFYFRHSQDLEALEGESGPTNTAFLLDLVAAAEPFIKKYWPKMNRNGMADDFLTMLREMFAVPAAPATPASTPDSA
jgi:hypothetical protein